MLQYCIVCPLVFLAGFVYLIAGGGGLISLPAYIIAGVPAHFAIGTNKLSSTLGTSISTWRYLETGISEGKTADSASRVCLLYGSGRPQSGFSFSMMVSDTAPKHMMIVMLPIVAFYVLRNKNMGDSERTGTISKRRVCVISLAASFVIGTYDGFYGPGTGTFLILMLTGAARMDMRTAAAQTKVINLSSNISALVTFILTGNVYYTLGAAASVCSVAGHYLGAGLVVHDGQKIVRPMVLVVLGILFLKIIAGA
ncbi:MAG: TSUP family transporter [Lachnospiraceae bacterium]